MTTIIIAIKTSHIPKDDPDGPRETAMATTLLSSIIWSHEKVWTDFDLAKCGEGLPWSLIELHCERCVVEFSSFRLAFGAAKSDSHSMGDDDDKVAAGAVDDDINGAE